MNAKQFSDTSGVKMVMTAMYARPPIQTKTERLYVPTDFGRRSSSNFPFGLYQTAGIGTAEREMINYYALDS